MAVLANSGIGRARHSVRAVAVNQNVFIVNSNGQRTAHPAIE